MGSRNGEGFEYDDDDEFGYMDDACCDNDEFEEDCGLMPDGQCLLAGTEHCDWDCGRLNAQRIAAMKAVQDRKVQE